MYKKTSEYLSYLFLCYLELPRCPRTQTPPSPPSSIPYSLFFNSSCRMNCWIHSRQSKVHLNATIIAAIRSTRLCLVNSLFYCFASIIYIIILMNIWFACKSSQSVTDCVSV